MVSAIELLSRNGHATMSEIALNAGVGRATLHRLFNNRDELIRSLQERCIKDTNAAVLASDDPGLPAIERLRNMFAATIPLGDKYTFLKHEVANDHTVREAYSDELRWVGTLVKKLRAEGAVRDDVPAAWVVTQIDQLVWSAWSEVSAGRLAPADAPDLAIRTLINGLGVTQ